MPSTRARILIAEDEAPLRNLVRMSLEAVGHEVIAVSDGEETLHAFANQPFDLVILDVMMPKLDGFSVCEQIRKVSSVPIIMLTALGSTDDLVKGFELGADDYVAKPFTFKEVQARINAVLRRVQWSEEKKANTVIQIGRVLVDAEAQEAFVDGQSVHLTPIEFRLLYTLMASAGKPIAKSDLFAEVWGYDFIGGTNLVEVTVRRLREKVELDPSHPSHILTERGTGYRFRAIN